MTQGVNGSSYTCKSPVAEQSSKESWFNRKLGALSSKAPKAK